MQTKWPPQPSSVTEKLKTKQIYRLHRLYMQRQAANTSDFSFIWAIFTLEHQKQMKNQILKPKFHNASNFEYFLFVLSSFELKNLQRVRFWIKYLSPCQILKKNAFKISRFGSFYSVKMTFSAIFVFLNEEFWIKFLTMCQILKWKKITTRQIFNWIKSNSSDFDI